MQAIRFALIAVLLCAPTIGLAQDFIPQNRLAISQDVDLSGGDIASIFDTSFEACQQACLTNSECEAFTFNAANGSCFSKAGNFSPVPFYDAISGVILQAEPNSAEARRSELTFVQDWEVQMATDQATGLGNLHYVNSAEADVFTGAAREAEESGNSFVAAEFMGSATVLTDSADDWLNYARLLALGADDMGDQQRAYLDRSFSAAINAYLRAQNPALQHSILVQMGEVLARIDRGRDQVKALRLAQSLQQRDDTADALADASAMYGFRITETLVQSDLARPRICAVFSEEIDPNIADFSQYVVAREEGVTIAADGAFQICAEGVTHGARYQLTFRAGLPAKDGQSLIKAVDVTSYVRDRSPAVRFAGRGYVLPRSSDAALPVQTVNTGKLDLSLYRITDRNLMRVLQNGFLSAPMAEYQEQDFSNQIGAMLWQGSAEVVQSVNEDVTTRLPLGEALAGQSAGIYALRATVPGSDPYVTPAAWQWFVVSDIGITTLSGADGLHVFARSLGTAGAIAGADVQLISNSNDVLASLVTDSEGYAQFDASLTRGLGASAPALVLLRRGDDDLAFLSLKDAEFDLSDRGVAGLPAAPPVNVFMATDRGAYRAGETVFVTALARDAGSAAIEGLPLTAILTRPDGVEYLRMVVADGGAGGHVFSLPIAASAPRGQWKVDLRADLDAPPLSTKTFLVEDFLPERIDFDLAISQQPLRLNSPLQVMVDARYLFGAPAANLNIEGEVVLRKAAGLPQWQGYSFGRHDSVFSASIEPFFGVQTGDDGKADLSLAMPQVEDPNLPLEIEATLRMADGSARPIERRLVQGLAPSAPMIGIKPLFDGAAPEGGEARFSIIHLDNNAAPSSADLTWAVTRIETQYQWYQQGGSWNWEPVTTRSKVAEGKLTTVQSAIEIAAPVTWGEYELSINGPNARASALFSAGWFGGADVAATPDMLEMSLDATSYRAGDTAKLRIVPRAAGTALVSVLSNRLIAMKAVDVVAGENLIDLPVTDEWGTGVYVTVSALRAANSASDSQSRASARALGITHAAIDPAARALQTSIETAPQADPRGPLDIAVKVEGITAGEAAFVTIAAVDQGILNLSGYTPPNPSAHYFGQRKLGVGIRDVYGRLIDASGGAMGIVRSGGDAGAGARLQAPPPTEELVAYFTGPIAVGADGYARTSFDLPSFNGTVKVMAIAWSKTGVGQADSDVLVRDPVVIAASLPRFLALGDSSTLTLDFTHTGGEAGDMPLQISAQEGLTLDSAPQSVSLDAVGSARITLQVSAETVTDGRIDLSLTTPEGRVLQKTLYLPVIINDAPIVRTSRLDLAAGATFTADENLFDGLRAGTSQALITAGPMARLNAAGVLSALGDYGYACTEQITSQAMPLLYLPDLAAQIGIAIPENVDAQINQALTAVLVTQNSSGAFGLWGAGYGGDMWLDAYVTDFLSRARAKGYAVPDAAFRAALDNLRNQVNYFPDFDYGGEGLAYALMVLAREGAAAIGDLRYFADEKGDAFATPAAMAQLGAALTSYGDQPRSDAMFARAGAAVGALSDSAPEQVFRADYGTDLRDTAVVLALANEAGSNVINREALTARLAASGTLSPQESAWTLLAAASTTMESADLLVNGAPNTAATISITGSAVAPAQITNNGADTYITITTSGVPIGAEAAGGTGYAITRSYFTPDGVPADLGQVSVGTRLVAVLEITTFGRGEARLMVNDPLPAGFAIDNPSLMSSANTALSGFDFITEAAHSEFRQDRFLTAIDRMDNAPFRLGYVVRAVSAGEFHHPAAVVEDMYRPDLSGRTDTGRLIITP
jgi:alpha-2-macroglobulin